MSGPMAELRVLHVIMGRSGGWRVGVREGLCHNKAVINEISQSSKSGRPAMHPG